MSVVVFGSLNMDLVTRVKRLPKPGETLMGSAFFTTAGGKGANQAVAAAKLGAVVKMIGRVGDDVWGTELIAGLTAAGVETDGITTEPGVHSGVAVITVAESGENQILGVYGANDRLDESDVERLKTRLIGAKVLLLQLEVPVQAVKQAAQVAHEMRVTVVLDPAPVREESIAACYPFVDFLIPNETEASQLVGFEVRDVETATQASLVLHRQGVRNVIIKLGAKGAYYSKLRSPIDATDSQLETLWVPAFNVKAIDAVAAGDAFAGGFAVALAEGQTEVEAVRWGCGAGALATTKVGAQVAMSDRVTFDQFLAGVT